MKRLFMSLALLVSVFSIAYGQGQIHKLQSIFIYNFTKHIEWPTQGRQGNFTIGVIGSTPLKQELKNLASNKQVDNRALEVKEYSSVNAIDGPQILFISKSQADKLEAIKNKLGNSPTLTICESPGAAKNGIAINFVVRNNRQKFELNPSAAKNHNLKVSGYLEKLAILVN